MRSLSLDTSAHALVVGAGLAGLSAALELEDRGVAATVIEARERVGGRVWSVPLSNGSIAELGAEWVMPGDEAVRSVCGRFGLPLAEAGVDYLRRTPFGPDAASLEEQDQTLSRVAQARSRLPEAEVASLTVGAFLDSLDVDARSLRTLWARLQGTASIDLHRVALRAMDGEHAFAAPAARYHRVAEGNQSMAIVMARDLDVRLGHRATRVEQDDARVVVEALVRDSDPVRLSGDVAVVAVPVAIVPELDFEPALPERQAAALAELPTGVASKLSVPLAGEPTLRAIQSSELPFWCWTANDARGRPRRNVSSFCGSELAQIELRTGGGDSNAWIERLQALNPDLVLEGEPRMHAWAEDDLARGSYSVLDNAGYDRLELLARAHGRVAFAGEHTAGAQHHATMEGAIRSGRRAAEQALELIVHGGRVERGSRRRPV